MEKNINRLSADIWTLCPRGLGVNRNTHELMSPALDVVTERAYPPFGGRDQHSEIRPDLSMLTITAICAGEWMARIQKWKVAKFLFAELIFPQFDDLFWREWGADHSYHTCSGATLRNPMDPASRL